VRHCHWQASDRQLLKRLNRLIDAILRGDPYEGIGKPEEPRYLDTWSRRINDEHRLVYRVDNDDRLILRARYHYSG
jgi:toxin YoeB